MISHYRLEYSETQGLFHFEGQKKDAPAGWGILCKKISITQASEFCDKMEEKYPELQNRDSKNFPSHKTIKDEFTDFLLTD